MSRAYKKLRAEALLKQAAEYCPNTAEIWRLIIDDDPDRIIRKMEEFLKMFRAMEKNAGWSLKQADRFRRLR